MKCEFCGEIIEDFSSAAYIYVNSRFCYHYTCIRQALSALANRAYEPTQLTIKFER